MPRTRGSALLLSLLMLLTSLALLAPAATAATKEESPNFSQPVAADRFGAGWQALTLLDSQNEQYSARIYYPSSSEGEGVVVDCAWSPYPWIAFHADEGEGEDSYSWIGEGLARAGYVVLTIDEHRAGDDAWNAVLDHWELIARMGHMNYTGGLNSDPQGIQGCIDMDHWGIGGHGRGAALAAVVQGRWAALDSSGVREPPRALFGLGLDTADTGTSVPVSELPMPAHSLFLTGTVDEVAPADEHIDPFLTRWPGGWQLLEVVGGNHVQYEDDQSFWDNLWDGAATIDETEQQQHALDSVTPYLDLILKGDDASWYAASNRESDPEDPTDSMAYVTEDLRGDQFYHIDISASITDGPRARYSSTMFFDSLSNRTILHGGMFWDWPELPYLDDTWTLDMSDSGAWQSDSSSNRPGDLLAPAFASDGAADGLLYGAADSSGDLWRWNGWSGTWSEYPAGPRPNATGYSSIVWDAGDGTYLLYGGRNVSALDFYNETWSFDPASGYWQILNTSNSPTGIVSPAMFYSPAWNRTFLFGGMDVDGNHSNETWMFNRESNSWSRLQLPGAHPEARSAAAYAVDLKQQVAYLWGGVSSKGYLGDLWAFDMQQLTWQQLATSGPPAAQWSSMSWDSHAERLVLFGGNLVDGQSDQTWLFDVLNSTWTLHDSTSAVTISETIHMEASVSERDLGSPPSNLTVECRIIGSSTNWTAGSWNTSSDIATCDMSPFGVAPGFHNALLRVSVDHMGARVVTSFERANAPPNPVDPMPSFVMEESSILVVNVTSLATDVDGHDVEFDTSRTPSLTTGDPPVSLSPEFPTPERLVLQDTTDWESRTEDGAANICVDVRDVVPPQQTSFTIEICFDVTVTAVDDQLQVISDPSLLQLQEDESFTLELSQFVYDEEGATAVVESVNASQGIVASVEGTVLTLRGELDWHGSGTVNVSMSDGTSDSISLIVGVQVASVPDEPRFNFTEITLAEDEILDMKLSDLVYDPDGEEVNVTLETGEPVVNLSIWHQYLRIIPEADWNGNSVNWAVVATSGEDVVRQPMRIIVESVNDITTVEWQDPGQFEDNVTKLRFTVTDRDSDGPWVVQFNWDDANWQELSPSCARAGEIAASWECQLDLLAHGLTYGDHELNLRVFDGEDTSPDTTFWLDKNDPNAPTTSTTGGGPSIPPMVWVVGGLVALLGGAVLLFVAWRADPEQ